jgi:nucleotide-binding universal stress UspA family protein
MVLSDSPDEHEASELARELSPDRDLTVARADGVAVAAGSLPPADPPPAAILRPIGRSRGGAVLQPALTSAAHGLEPAARLDVASDVFVGDPADTLIRASKRAGLLVLGSRAYGSASEVHAGGVARRVLAAARCPVVLVPRETARG